MKVTRAVARDPSLTKQIHLAIFNAVLHKIVEKINGVMGKLHNEEPEAGSVFYSASKPSSRASTEPPVIDPKMHAARMSAFEEFIGTLSDIAGSPGKYLEGMVRDDASADIQKQVVLQILDSHHENVLLGLDYSLNELAKAADRGAADTEKYILKYNVLKKAVGAALELARQEISLMYEFSPNQPPRRRPGISLSPEAAQDVVDNLSENIASLADAEMKLEQRPEASETTALIPRQKQRAPSPPKRKAPTPPTEAAVIADSAPPAVPDSATPAE